MTSKQNNTGPAPANQFFITDCDGKRLLMQFQTERYADADQLCVYLLHEGELYTVLSVCLPEVELASDEFVFKTYGHGGFYEELIEQGVIEHVRFIPFVRFTIHSLPVCRLTKGYTVSDQDRWKDEWVQL